MTDTTTVDSDSNAYAMTNWVYGYYTGVNIGMIGLPTFNLNSLTVPEVWSSVYGYCARNPEEPGYKAALALLSRFRMEPFRELPKD